MKLKPSLFHFLSLEMHENQEMNGRFLILREGNAFQSHSSRTR